MAGGTASGNLTLVPSTNFFLFLAFSSFRSVKATRTHSLTLVDTVAISMLEKTGLGVDNGDEIDRCKTEGRSISRGAGHAGKQSLGVVFLALVP